MNAKRRKKIASIIILIEDFKGSIENLPDEAVKPMLESLRPVQDNIDMVYDEEGESLSNLSENLEGSPLYNNIEAAYDNLDSAKSEMEDLFEIVRDNEDKAIEKSIITKTLNKTINYLEDAKR